MTGFVLCLALLSVAVSVYGDLSGCLGANDVNRFKKLSQRVASNSSSAGRDIFFALQLAGMSQSIDKLCKCDALSDKLRSPRSPVDAYYLVQAGDLCSCGLKLPKALTQALVDALQVWYYLISMRLDASNFSVLQSDDVSTVAAAILLSRKFKASTAETEEAAFNHLKSLVLVDGELNISFSDVNTSTSKIHFLLEALLALKDEPYASQFITDVVEKVFQLIPGGDGDSLADATFIFPLSSLSAKKLRIEKNGLKAAAEQLLSLKYSDDAFSLYLAYKSLEVIRSYKAAPVYLSLENALFTNGQVGQHNLKVIAYDLLGHLQEIDEVELISLKVVGKDSFVMQNVKEKGNTVSFAGENLAPGRYGVNFAATLKEKTTTIRFQTAIIVGDAQIEVTEVYAGLSDSKQTTSSELSEVKAQNSFSGLSASAQALDVLHVMYQVQASRKPHQSMVRLTNTETGNTAVFAAARLGDGSLATEYHVSIAFADEVEAFAYESGEYLLSVLVADVTFTTPVEWIVGSVDLKFPTKSAPNLPLYARSLLHTSDTTLRPLPEVEHAMRPPAKRASSFMSGLFTLLTLTPLAVFLFFNLSLRPNFARLKSLSSAVFVACLVAIVLLYAGYWLALDGVSFYDTIKYICFLFPVTIFVGRYALTSVASVRLAEGTKNK